MDNTYAERLIEARNRAWEEGKALLDSVDAENRDFNAEEAEKWDRINSDITAKDARIQELLDIDEREARAAEARSRYEGIVRPGAGAPATEPSVEERAADFFRGNGERGLELRIQSKLSAGAGAAAVPTGFLPELQRYLEENSAVLNAGPRFIDTDSGEDITVPRVTGYGSAALTAETSAATASDDTFGTATLNAYKYVAYVQVSRELIEDSGFDIVSYIAEDAGRKLGNAVGVDLVTGNGSSKPQGIVAGASAAVTASSAALTVDNLIDLMHSVVTGYRRNGVWLMKDSTVAYVRKLKDTTNNYLWQPSNIAGVPDTLLGKPVFSDPNVAAVGTGNKSVAFGDPKSYFVRRVNGVRFERSDDYAFNQDLATFKAVVRMDGKLVHANGIKVLVHS